MPPSRVDSTDHLPRSGALPTAPVARTSSPHSPSSFASEEDPIIPLTSSSPTSTPPTSGTPSPARRNGSFGAIGSGKRRLRKQTSTSSPSSPLDIPPPYAYLPPGLATDGPYRVHRIELTDDDRKDLGWELGPTSSRFGFAHSDHSVQPAQPDQRAQTVTPAQPAQPAQPTRRAQPAQPVRLTQPPQPGETAQPVQPTRTPPVLAKIPTFFSGRLPRGQRANPNRPRQRATAYDYPFRVEHVRPSVSQPPASASNQPAASVALPPPPHVGPKPVPQQPSTAAVSPAPRVGSLHPPTAQPSPPRAYSTRPKPPDPTVMLPAPAVIGWHTPPLVVDSRLPPLGGIRYVPVARAYKEPIARPRRSPIPAAPIPHRFLGPVPLPVEHAPAEPLPEWTPLAGIWGKCSPEQLEAWHRTITKYQQDAARLGMDEGMLKVLKLQDGLVSVAMWKALRSEPEKSAVADASAARQ